MLSRVADSIYWMSRYLERAENVARFVDVNMRLMLDMGQSHPQWKPLVLASGDEADFEARYGRADENSVIQFLTFDRENPNSIFSCVASARENARTVREIIPSEMWETINELYHRVQKQQRSKHNSSVNLQSFYHEVAEATNLFYGYATNAMSHGQGWHFARLGRMLERADKTARLLDVKYFLLLPDAKSVDSPFDAVQWGAVLKSATAFEMYRQQYHRVNYRDVTHFLILDELFPRSTLYCVNACAKSLAYITHTLDVDAIATTEVEKLQHFLQEKDVDVILSMGLHEFIDEFQAQLNKTHNAIYHSFFATEQAECA